MLVLHIFSDQVSETAEDKVAHDSTLRIFISNHLKRHYSYGKTID